MQKPVMDVDSFHKMMCSCFIRYNFCDGKILAKEGINQLLLKTNSLPINQTDSK